MRFMSILWLLACSDKPEGETETEVVEVDNDGDGVLEADDCDDNDASVFPGADEVCDEIDNDCDGLIDDEDDSVDLSTGTIFYADTDGDGFGGTTEVSACVLPEGAVENMDDCDDDNADVNPDANEVCDEIDNDCDGLIDDEDDSVDVSSQTQFFMDSDGDGFGDDNLSEITCTPSDMYIALSGDCNDADPSINPDAAEVCDGIDNDCDQNLDDPNMVSGITAGVYTDVSASFQGTSSSVASVTLTEDEYLFCDGTYYVTMEAVSDVSLSSLGTSILDGGQTSPVLFSSTDLIEVSISDMTVQNGSHGVRMDGQDVELTVDNVAFENNVLSSDGYVYDYFTRSGGGIFLEEGQLTVTDSSFTGNEANLGGAIYVGGDATINNTVFTDNVALLSGTYLGSGGGIFYLANSNGSSLEISDSDFESNEAEYTGSAISVLTIDQFNLTSFDCVTTLDNVTVTNNNDDGAAVMLWGGSSFITDSEFSNNTMVMGAALYVVSDVQGYLGTEYQSTVEVVNTVISGNTSSDSAALQVVGGSVVTYDGGSISGNTSGTNKGAITVGSQDSIFTSIGCDFGSAGTENTPDDVYTYSSSNRLYDYDGVQDFECFEYGCPELSCVDGVDDNGDGLADCDDDLCYTDPACAVPEDCTVYGDEDLDGLYDCDDPDCSLAPVCLAEDCSVVGDEDLDGLSDCDDPDCAQQIACLEEDCTTSGDEDLDGLSDCDDPDCTLEPTCNEFECQDGIDNDQNGYTDCYDTPCVEFVGTTVQMSQATEDWITPDTSCYDSSFPLQQNDWFIGENTTIDGCVRYFTESLDIDTILSRVDTCPSLGGTVVDCNDDVDFAGGDYSSQLFVDTTDGGEAALVLSAYNYTSTATDQSVVVQSDIPEVCYTLNMTDSYGDGWNNASLDITQDGVTTSYAATDDDGDGGCNSGCDETTSTTVCLDSVSFDLDWTSGQYDGEVSFELLAQDGTVVCSEGGYPSNPCGGFIVPTCDQL